MNRFSVILPLFALAFSLLLGSCGGTQLTGDDAAETFKGVTEGDFRAVRYDDAGIATGALNPTLDLQVQAGGTETVVTVAIADQTDMAGVTLDLLYDPQRYSPVDVEFDGLLETPVQLAVTDRTGLVALGQVSVEGSRPFAGQFATVTFRNEAVRNVTAVGDVHPLPINDTHNAIGTPGFELLGTTVDGTTNVDFNIYGLFAVGDGDQNGVSNISDLTPMGAFFQSSASDTDIVPARADYDQNGQVNVSDLTPLGANLQSSTDRIEVFLSDSATDITGLTPAFDFSFTADGTAPTGTPGTVSSDPSDAWKTWNGTVTQAMAEGADTNGDDTVFITARAVNDGSGDTGPLFDGLPITIAGSTGNPAFTITDLDFTIDGTEFSDGETASLVANSTVALEVTGFSGNYDPDGPGGTAEIAFTPTGLNGVPQGEYDTELARIQDDADYTVVTHVTTFSRTDGVLTITDNANGADSAVVFPDDEDGNTGEGALEISFPGTGITNPIISIDVTADPDAPLIGGYTTSGGQDGANNWLVDAVVDSAIQADFTFGAGGAPTPLDGTTVQVQLIDVVNHTVAANFTYTAGNPAAQGEFTIRDGGGGAYGIDAIVSPGFFQPGNTYALQISTPPTEHSSSVNKPGEFFTVGPVPPAADLVTLPSTEVASNVNQIHIVFPDPKIRRTPEVVFNPTDGSVTPINAGFTDVLKTSGREFALVSVGGTLYPLVIVAEGNDPSMIGPNTPDTIGTLVTTKDPDRITIDIAAHPNPDPGLTKDFAFKVFGPPTTPGDNSTRLVIGQGTFTVNDLAFDSNPVGVQFGVNIYDDAGRGDLALGSEDWSNNTLRTSTLPATVNDTGTPDILWIEFNGGRISDVTPGNNVSAVIRRNSDTQDMIKPIDVRIGGVGTGGLNYIGFLHLSQLDEEGAGGGGNLIAGTAGDFSVLLTQPGLAVPVPVPGTLVVTN